MKSVETGRHETVFDEIRNRGQKAIDAGRLDADRLANFLHLGREAAYEARKHDKAAAAEHKRRWKQVHQAQKAMYRDRDRG